MKINKFLDLSKLNSTPPHVVVAGHMGVGGQKGYIVSVNGIASCLPATQYKDPLKVVWYESN